MEPKKYTIDGETFWGAFIIIYILFSLLYTTVSGIHILWSFL